MEFNNQRSEKMGKERQPDEEWRAGFQGAQRWVNLVASYVAIVGIVDIVEALIPRESSVIEWIAQFLPMDVSESSRLGMYLTGFFLLAIARGIWRRKRAAWLGVRVARSIVPFVTLLADPAIVS